MSQEAKKVTEAKPVKTVVIKIASLVTMVMKTRIKMIVVLIKLIELLPKFGIN